MSGSAPSSTATISSSVFTSSTRPMTALDTPLSPASTVFRRGVSETAKEALQVKREAVCDMPEDEYRCNDCGGEVSDGEVKGLGMKLEEIKLVHGTTSPVLPSLDKRSVGKAELKDNVGPVRQAASGTDFDRFSLPTEEQIRFAQTCELVGELQDTVTFGSLIRQRGRQVVCVFLRHLWCGLCQQYVVALQKASQSLSSLSVEDAVGAYREPPFYVILISTGSPSLIPIYRSRLKCPFPLYVDPKRTLYKALGMTRKTWDAGKDKGSYVTKSQAGVIVQSTMSGLAMRRYPGSQKQLGGEFVFSTSPAPLKTPRAPIATADQTASSEADLHCLYASRMSTTRNHGEVRDLFAAAGVELTEAEEGSVFGE